MKLSIEFVEKAPEETILEAIPFYEGDPNLPENLIEALQLQSKAAIVESRNQNRLFGVRLGAHDESTKKNREEAGAALYKKATEGNDRSLLLDLRKIGNEGLDLVTGMLLSSWRFDKYRTVLKNERTLSRIVILSASASQLESEFKRLNAVCEGVCYARSLTSEPANILYPAAYAERLSELEVLGIGVEILDEDDLKTVGMTGMLAVGKGSAQPSRVVILTWNGANSTNPPVAIIGKGVCFDAGGLCIKPTAHQYEMKWDKAGAGVVAGLIKSLALSQAPVNVIGILGLVENMPDGAATKPGDVITTMSGQTVEILNTDAEGRLVLADCLWYAQQRFSPSTLIDLGTMTMETFASLGNVYAGLYSNDPALTQQLKSAGESTGDWIWELPMGPFFAKQIESDIADIKNLGIEFCGENGAAAEFLKRFVKNTPWVHLDIAGVSWTREDLPLCHKGVTGFGVRLLEEWLMKRIVRV
jgi:leucyl aminopeptidase